MEEGVKRWIVDISKWDPSPRDFSFALSLLPQHYHSSISRFVKMEDRKRALVSQLLQYALVHELLGIPYDEIIIKRTFEGKPYLEREGTKIFSEFPNFNFNVSHHGDFVTIASEPLCIVGVDIVCCIKPPNETVTDFIRSFTSYFSSLEWNNIISLGTPDEILVEFYSNPDQASAIADLVKALESGELEKYWSLKEAFVKAKGSGLVNGLNKVEFHHTNWTNIFIKIDGKPMTGWRFWLLELQNRHMMSVARGHPNEADESYKRTLSHFNFDELQHNNGPCLPNFGFVERTVEQLVQVLHGAICSSRRVK